MLTLNGKEAFDQLFDGVKAKTARYPSRSDAEVFRDGALFPRLTPKFKISRGEPVFTIGSCFAREIEWVLVRHGLSVPVTDFKIPMPPGVEPRTLDILNEYNAGTILQRVGNTVGAFNYPDDAGIEAQGDGYVDLFLDVDNPISLELIHTRRQAVKELYGVVPSCGAVIITLGLVESWFDTNHQVYLNRAPSRKNIQDEPGRFEFHRFDVNDVLHKMHKGISELIGIGIKKILLTVSPVPIQATFMQDNVIMANSYSKAVLRVAAETLKRQFSEVDYFPSYEIVTSMGLSGFRDDNVHVIPEVVGKVTEHMVASYLE